MAAVDVYVMTGAAVAAAFAAGCPGAHTGHASTVAMLKTQQLSGSWDPAFGTTGPDGPIAAMAFTSSGLYIGGDFSSVGGQPASGVAVWTPATETWSGLGTRACRGPVSALGFWNNEVYAAGMYPGGLAWWRDGDWGVLAGGLSAPGAVKGMIGTVDGRMYVFGNFVAPDRQESDLTQFDPATRQWMNVGQPALDVGTSEWLQSVARVGNVLVVGGRIAPRANPPLQSAGIARLDLTTKTWSSLGGGLTGGASGLPTVYAMAVDKPYLYVGGNFTTAHNSDGDVAAANIARWNLVTNHWEPVGDPGAGTDGIVTALIARDGYVFVGGMFAHAGGQQAASAASWDAARRWQPLGSGLTTAGGSAGQVDAIAVLGSTVYFGGEFANADGTAVKSIARWTESRWRRPWLGLEDNTPGSPRFRVVGSLLVPSAGYQLQLKRSTSQPGGGTLALDLTVVPPSTPQSPSPTIVSVRYEEPPAHYQWVEIRGAIHELAPVEGPE